MLHRWSELQGRRGQGWSTSCLIVRQTLLPAPALKSFQDLIRWSQECLFVAGSDPGGAETFLCHSSDNSTQVSFQTINPVQIKFIGLSLYSLSLHWQYDHWLIIIMSIIQHHLPSEWLWFFVTYITPCLNKCKSLINLRYRVTKDVALEGYHIPKDSLALANLIGFMQVFGHCQKRNISLILSILFCTRSMLWGFSCF